MGSETATDYVNRVNRAIDYILGHLEEPLSLETVAQRAHFSPFHFHRVFRSLVGETLNAFIKRLRLERAVTMVARTPKGEKPNLTQIALRCGFGSSSDFSRSFKQRYGVPPSAFDFEVHRDERRSRLQDSITDPEHRHLLDRLPPGANPDGFEVEIRELPPRTVAYIRVLDPYNSHGVPEACARLVAWAEQRGYAEGQWLGYMWDDPDIVDHRDCRYDAAVVVDRVEAAGEIGRFEFPAMRVAQVEVRGPIDLEMRALDWLFGTWLPTSGYLPSAQPCFESWVGRPFAHGMGHFELDIHLPIEPARG